MYAVVTVAMITVFVRDWTDSEKFDACNSAPSIQIRSVQFYTEIELVLDTEH